MRICHVFHRDYPWDVRVEKICRALIKRGHEVHLLCNNSKQKPQEEILEKIYIHRLPVLKSRKLNRVITFPAFFNIHWNLHIYRTARRYEFDAILVRDLPLVLPVWLVTRNSKAPLVYDMAENFPAMLENFSSMIKSPFLARILEIFALRIVDHVFVVVEESKQRIINKGIPINNITVVSNTPELDLFAKHLAINSGSIPRRNRFNLLYVGYITHLRGLDVVIKGLPNLIENIPNINLTIVGDGSHLPNLKKLTQDMKLESYIDFTGWLDFKYIPSIISKCDVGIIPHCSNDHTNSTIPNKLFDYMAFGKPVIVSDAKPLKRIVEETGCGIVFKSEDPDDFSRKLISLAQTSTSEKAQMGKRGQQAVSEFYNWEKDAERLCSLFESFMI
jgi:glycosyltransferase involved in cell wall biosynthesis